jgi:hypothetical protein
VYKQRFKDRSFSYLIAVEKINWDINKGKRALIIVE